jgi:hypothetical protein
MVFSKIVITTRTSLARAENRFTLDTHYVGCLVLVLLEIWSLGQRSGILGGEIHLEIFSLYDRIPRCVEQPAQNSDRVRDRQNGKGDG